MNVAVVIEVEILDREHRDPVRREGAYLDDPVTDRRILVSDLLQIED